MPTRWEPPWPVEFVVGAKPPWTGWSRWSETGQLSLERAQSWGLRAKGQGTDTGDMKEFPIQAPSEGNLGTCPAFLTCLAPFLQGCLGYARGAWYLGLCTGTPRRTSSSFLPSCLPRGYHRVPASFVAPRFCIWTRGRDVSWWPFPQGLPGPEKEPTVPGSPLSMRTVSPPPGPGCQWLMAAPAIWSEGRGKGVGLAWVWGPP